MLYPQIDNTLLATAIGGVTLLGLLSGLAAALINRDTSHQGGAQHLRTRCASAFGTYRTSLSIVNMSALGRKADIRDRRSQCPLMTQGGP